MRILQKILIIDLLCLKKIFEKLPNVRIIKPEGSYYCIIDVSSYRNKLNEKFYSHLDDKSMRSDFLDRAFCRMFYSKEIGLIPLSGTQFCGEFDYLIRISLNRRDADYEILNDAVDELILEYQIDK